jgi:hypothetical protein
LTIIEEGQAKKKEMMIRLKYGKKRERANKQAKQEKEERITTTTNTLVKASTTVFSSSSLSLTLAFFFFATYIRYSYDSNRPSFMVLKQNFSFFSLLLSKHVYNKINT